MSPAPDDPQTPRDRRNRLAGRILLLALGALLAAYFVPMLIR